MDRVSPAVLNLIAQTMAGIVTVINRVWAIFYFRNKVLKQIMTLLTAENAQDTIVCCDKMRSSN